MDFSNIVTEVPVFHQPVAFPPGSAEDTPFLVQIHGGKWSRQTKKPVSFLVSCLLGKRLGPWPSKVRSGKS